MKHKIKVTVIDKKLYPKLQENIVLIQKQELVLVTMQEMNLFLKETGIKMIFGTWG